MCFEVPVRPSLQGDSPSRVPGSKRKAGMLVLAGLAALQSPNAFAGRLLDFIRAYDLNDYALGASVSVSQTPYAGTDNSVFAYPYLTSFRHAAFTDDWLLIRDENLGVRYVTQSDWEFGVIGRIQTLGIGGNENPNLSGLDERNWAIEAGPLVGWRGSLLQAHLRSYWEVPNRHSGTTSELELSLPMEFSRGFVVPALTFKYLSSDYSNYYFGVSDREVTSTRSAYQPGAAVNTQIGLYLGYELTPRWLLKASSSLELLDSSISRSPIVGRDRLLSASLGFAYNADVFQAKDHVSLDNDRKVELRASAFNSRMSSDARKDGASGVGDAVGFEDFLGVSNRENVFLAEVFFRVGFYHRFELSVFETDRGTTATLQDDFAFGEELFLAGTEVDSTFDTRRLRFAYSYSLMRDSQKELGVSAGISYNRVEVSIEADSTQQSETVTVDSPLPTMGVFGSVAFRQSWRLGAELSLFAMDIDRYSGYSGHVGLTLDRQFGEQFAAGVGYDLYATRLKAGDDDLRGLIRFRNYGPRFYMSWFF